MSHFPAELVNHLERSRVVAGFTVDDAGNAVPLAEALLAGGVDVIELTLRSPAAMEGIRRICAEVPDMLVGVGTILTPKAVEDVKAAGAHFGVSPGMNPRVVEASVSMGLPFAPGICTPTDLEAAIELGCRFVKFFPAEACGGLAYLRSMAAPYRHLGIQYMPLGGLNSVNMLDYLAEDIVPAIGGSWIVKNELVAKKDWTAITARAAEVQRQLEVLATN